MTARRSPLAALLGLCLLLLAPLGCGGGDDDTGRAGTTASVTTATASAPAAPPADAPVRADGDTVEVQLVARGLEVPWDIAFLPDGGALITERPGRVRRLDADGELVEDPVARIDVQARGEGGLMGLALDPAFDDGRPFAYTMVTDDGEVRVLRLRWDGERLRRATTVLDGIEAGAIHDSGRLRFGPDDRLYVVTGDAGRRELAPDRSSRNGKVLRLTLAQARGDGPAEPEVVSIGHRNPQGLDWQPGSGRLFVTEHGPSGFDGPSCCDELNLVEEGGNYGWPRFGEDQPASAEPAKLWQQTIAPSGMAFVSQPGSAWTGDVLVAALKGTALHRLAIDGASVDREEVLLDGRYGRLRAVVEAPDGSVWVTTSNLDTYGERTSPEDDRVLRILPPAD